MNNYEIITNHLIGKLAEGVIPWRKDWKESRANGGGTYGRRAAMVPWPSSPLVERRGRKAYKVRAASHPSYL
jgi:hypothetical protein